MATKAQKAYSIGRILAYASSRTSIILQNYYSVTRHAAVLYSVYGALVSLL
jgi:hypothetical protein